MVGRNFILYNFLFFFISKMVDGRVYNFTSNRNLRKSKEVFPVIPGIKMYCEKGEIGIELSFRDVFSGNIVEGRNGGGNRTGPLQRIIRTIMMIPLVIQILSLPGALAEIKMSLLKSLMVAKLALIMLIFNTIKNTQKEIVVVQKAPVPQHFDHYYHPYPEKEDEDKGWFGFGR